MHTNTRKADTFVLDLNAQVSLEQQIRRGNYGYVNLNYYRPGSFALTLSGRRKVVLYDTEGLISSQEMITRMRADRCAPATLDDALAFGAKFPDRHREHALVFLGTVWHGPLRCGHVPVLFECCGVRRLALCWVGTAWDGRYRFPAVCEL